MGHGSRTLESSRTIYQDNDWSFKKEKTSLVRGFPFGKYGASELENQHQESKE
jgi:hypothetical protein